MPIPLTIEGLSDEVYEALVRRARVEGLTLPDFVSRELTRLVWRPSPAQFWGSVERRIRETGTRLSAESILEARER